MELIYANDLHVNDYFSRVLATGNAHKITCLIPAVNQEHVLCVKKKEKKKTLIVAFNFFLKNGGGDLLHIKIICILPQHHVILTFHKYDHGIPHYGERRNKY